MRTYKFNIMLRASFLVLLAFSVCFCHDEAHVGVVDEFDQYGYENEVVSIDLKRKDEDIKILAAMRIHIIGGIVHMNNNPMVHNVVNRVSTYLRITIIKDNIRQKPEMKLCYLRILVLEKTLENGEKMLLVEQEFLEIEDFKVIQVEVNQVVFESMRRKPITKVLLKESEIHKRPVELDTVRKIEHHHHRQPSPTPPTAPTLVDSSHHHYHHHRKYYIIGGAIGLIIIVIGLTAWFRMQRAKTVAVPAPSVPAPSVPAPSSDTVVVNMSDDKKENMKVNPDFHFVEMNDKKALVE